MKGSASVIAALAAASVMVATLALPAHTQGQKETRLRDVMQKNTYSSPNPGQNDVLFVRTHPVRALVQLQSETVVAKAELVIAQLATAFGLQSEFGRNEVNLFVTELTGLKSATLEDMTSQFQKWRLPARIAPGGSPKDWQTGCYTHLSPTIDGRVGLGIILMDASLTDQDKSECMVIASLRVFGLGSDKMSGSDFENFLLLAMAIRQCNPSKPRSQIVDCVTKDRAGYFEFKAK